MYQLLYDFFIGNIWNSASLSEMTFEIGNNVVGLDVWLSHTSVIIVLAVVCVLLFMLVKWAFNVFSDLLKLGRD